MTQPKILTVPFARDAGGPYINEIPEAPVSSEPQRASLTMGFPPITMQQLALGGLPPQGQDFNGILNLLSEHIVFQNKGGLYQFSADIVAAGGYDKGAVLLSDDESNLWISTENANTQNPNVGTPTRWVKLSKASDLTSYVPTSRTITAGTGLDGGGSLAANRTFSVKYGTAAGTAAQGNDSRIVGAAQKSANLSDLSNSATARTNLGLGTAATRNVGTGNEDLRTNSQNDARFIQGGSVVQGLGSSTINVPSQKLLNDLLATKANLNQPGSMGIGVGQTWQNVTGSRTYGVTYTNSTGRPIALSIGGVGANNQTWSLIVEGVTIFTNSGQAESTTPGHIFAVIPTGHTYRLNASSSDVMAGVWAELR